jgi:exosortase/archaeosortase family protein
MHETVSPQGAAWAPGVARGGAAEPWRRRAPAAVPRLLAALSLVAVGVGVLLAEERLRFAEAALTAWALHGALGRPSRTLTTDPVFLYQQVAGDDTSWAGLAVTPACTAAFYVGGVLVVGGLLLLSRRNSVPRVAAAVLAAVALLVVVNTGRMILIAEAQARWGEQGFGWTHTVVGSVLMVVTLGGCAVLFARLGLLRRGRRNPA